ncbi:LacI family DNA-binding transcriptional regulator [Corynebacterium uterequi]|uniref:Transcriptional regulator, LacI family n=1 Tax=Corynebacterium uterequi TaxID=1072256 RepID=A0A0G3HFQ1_9CORY|nr:LacI family DNA-binding transcriptional regulator [Corynebacterium uterequi]AKK10778.1 transcriptional regulator, LacI family [Corynebacterium uterequi]
MAHQPHSRSRVTLKDVAREAGVSVSTASRALAGNPVITASTREHVVATAGTLGYRPNAQARALKGARTNTLGVIVPTLANHYFATMVTAIEHAASQQRQLTIVVSNREDPAELANALEILRSQRVDGIICVPHEGARAAIEEAADTPMVLIDREVDAAIPTIVSEAAAAIDEAVGALAPHGRLGYVAGPASTSTGRRRTAAFHEACRRRGITDAATYTGGYTRESGRAGADALLDAGATALLAGDSMMTIGALDACHRRGVTLGEDVLLVGFDRHPVFELQPVPVAVIDQDVEAMATRAWALLDALIDGQPPPAGVIRTPALLVPRPSMNPLIRR